MPDQPKRYKLSELLGLLTNAHKACKEAADRIPKEKWTQASINVAKGLAKKHSPCSCGPGKTQCSYCFWSETARDLEARRDAASQEGQGLQEGQDDGAVDLRGEDRGEDESQD